MPMPPATPPNPGQPSRPPSAPLSTRTRTDPSPPSAPTRQPATPRLLSPRAPDSKPGYLPRFSAGTPGTVTGDPAVPLRSPPARHPVLGSQRRDAAAQAASMAPRRAQTEARGAPSPCELPTPNRGSSPVQRRDPRYSDRRSGSSPPLPSGAPPCSGLAKAQHRNARSIDGAAPRANRGPPRPARRGLIGCASRPGKDVAIGAFAEEPAQRRTVPKKPFGPTRTTPSMRSERVRVGGPVRREVLFGTCVVNHACFLGCDV